MKKLLLIFAAVFFAGFAFAESSSDYEADLSLGYDYENWVAAGNSGRNWKPGSKAVGGVTTSGGTKTASSAQSGTKNSGGNTSSSKGTSSTSGKTGTVAKAKNPNGLQWKNEFYAYVGIPGGENGLNTLEAGYFFPGALGAGYTLWVTDHIGIGIVDEVNANLFQVRAGLGPFNFQNRIYGRVLYEWLLDSKVHIYHGVFGGVIMNPMDKSGKNLTWSGGVNIAGIKIPIGNKLNLFAELSYLDYALLDAGISWRF